MASEQHIEDRKVRILSADKISSLNDDDLVRYRRHAGLELRRVKLASGGLGGEIDPEDQKRIDALTWAFRESERELARRR